LVANASLRLRRFQPADENEGPERNCGRQQEDARASGDPQGLHSGDAAEDKRQTEHEPNRPIESKYRPDNEGIRLHRLTLLVMPGLDPRTHPSSKKRWIAPQLGLARVAHSIMAANPVHRTCGVKPDDDDGVIQHEQTSHCCLQSTTLVTPGRN